MISYSTFFRDVLADVGVKASEAQKPCIDTGDVLLALLRSKWSAVRWVIRLSGGSVETLIDNLLSRDPSHYAEDCMQTYSNDVSPKLSDKVKECINSAANIASATNSNDVSIEHLIIALSQVPESVAYEVLQNYGVKYTALQSAVEQLEALLLTPEDFDTMGR